MSKCQNKVEAVNCLKSDRKIFVRNNAKSCQFETDTQRKLKKVHWEKLFPPNKKNNVSYCRDRDIRTCYWSHGYHKNNNKSFLSIWRSSNDPGTDAPERYSPVHLILNSYFQNHENLHVGLRSLWSILAKSKK